MAHILNACIVTGAVVVEVMAVVVGRNINCNLHCVMAVVVVLYIYIYLMGSAYP